MTTPHFISRGKPRSLHVVLSSIQIRKTTHMFSFIALGHFYLIFKLIERKQDSVYDSEI